MNISNNKKLYSAAALIIGGLILVAKKYFNRKNNSDNKLLLEKIVAKLLQDEQVKLIFEKKMAENQPVLAHLSNEEKQLLVKKIGEKLAKDNAAEQFPENNAAELSLEPIKLMRSSLQSTMTQSNVVASNINLSESKHVEYFVKNRQNLQKRNQWSNILPKIQDQISYRSFTSFNSKSTISKYQCPLTKKIMNSPAVVCLPCQCTIIRYERQAIQKWLNEEKCCPICKTKLTHQITIKPDNEAKKKITRLIQSINNKKKLSEKARSQQTQKIKQVNIQDQQQDISFRKINYVSSILKPQSSIFVYQDKEFDNPISIIIDATSQQSSMVIANSKKTSSQLSYKLSEQDSQKTHQ